MIWPGEVAQELCGFRLGKGAGETARWRRAPSPIPVRAPLRVEETFSRFCRSNASKEHAMREDGIRASSVEREPAPKDMSYEVADFARKHGLSMVEARSLIEKVGNDCMKLDAGGQEAQAQLIEVPSPCSSMLPLSVDTEHEVRRKSEDIDAHVMSDVLKAVVSRVKKIDRDHDIPYIAGYSQNGEKIYIDRHMPKSAIARRQAGADRSLPHPARGRRKSSPRRAWPSLPARASDRAQDRKSGGGGGGSRHGETTTPSPRRMSARSTTRR